jgi:hypothetical protein
MNIDPGVIRISISPEVALNPTGFGNLIGEIATKLGCEACFSGFNCLLQRTRDYVINPAGKALPQDPIPLRQGAAPAVNIVMSNDAARDVKALKQIAEVAFGKLGCLPCTSGFDVLLQSEIRTLVIGKNFDVREFGRPH